MYKFYSKGCYKRFISREQVKLLEAEHRGLRKDYQVTFPNGDILDCKFNNSAENPNKQE